MIWFHLILILATQISLSLQGLPDLEDPPAFGVPTLHLDSLQLTLSSKLLLDVYSPHQSTNLRGYLGWLPRTPNYTSCSTLEADSICLEYDRGMRLTVKQDDGAGFCEADALDCDAVTCHRVRWNNHVGGAMDCFVIGEDEWYGGGLTLDQRWPVQEQSRAWYPVVTGDPIHHPSGNVVENVWLSSGGFVIHVEDDVPLFASFNESGSGKLCLTTSTRKHPYRNEGSVTLEYSICSAPDVKEANLYALRKWGRKPTGVPDERMFQYPVWSTWARFKAGVNQSAAVGFAHEVKLADFPTSQMEIDDRWEGCYGDLRFDPDKFPDPAAMVAELRSVGFATTLWVHPFCNVQCVAAFETGREFWVKDREGRPLEVRWWNGEAAGMLDATNPEAVEWFARRLKFLQTEYGIESFKFDAGEVLWLQSDFVFHDPLANRQPNLYSRRYAELASRFGGHVEVRTGFGTQHLPVFTRVMDKDSTWGRDNGLASLIPSVLQLSSAGYFFVLPDMVGGNNYGVSPLPDRELFVRWLEASVFLPSLQFSIAPWDFSDEETVRIARRMVDLHDKYSVLVLDLARKAVATGEPIVRPLWWVAPDDAEALRCDSQFLLGDNLLVAPVLEKGRTARDIYLPEGKWADVQRGKAYEGAMWLYDYSSPIGFLPFFIRHY